jgi:hypothetical protein
MLCIIAPSKQKVHRYPVDCYRFFSDGMIALSRYYSLDLLHATCDVAPEAILQNFDQYKNWFSAAGDSMLICRKPYPGNPRKTDLRSYKLFPEKEKDSPRGFASFEDVMQHYRLKAK